MAADITPLDGRQSLALLWTSILFHDAVINREEIQNGEKQKHYLCPLRYLMYARCYGELNNARSLFNELPLKVRKRMAHIDYRTAEQKCPQRLNIGRLMREAATELV
jgi:hypothetical protein